MMEDFVEKISMQHIWERQFHMWQNWCLVFADCYRVQTGVAELFLGMAPYCSVETALQALFI